MCNFSGDFMKTNLFSSAIILSIFLLNGFVLTAQIVPNFFANPNITADKIIYVTNASGNDEIMKIDSDGTNLTNLTNNAANDFAPAYSPTLDKFVFVSNRTGTNQIFVMNADGTNQTNLSNSPMSDDTNPSWSPDGAKIVFMRDGMPDFEQDGVSTMNADGSNQFRVYYLSNFSGKPAFSPDGTFILFHDGIFNVLSIEPDGSNISLVASADSGSPTYLSPDGAKLLFVNFDEFGVRQIFTGSDYTQLTFFSTDAILPKWSPDGTKITFAVLFAPNAYRIYTMNADGSNQTEITPNSSLIETYSFPEWSPDNLRIAFTGYYQINNNQNVTGLGKVNSDGTSFSFLAAAYPDKHFLWTDPTALPVIRFSRSGFLGFDGFETFDLERQIKVFRSGNLSQTMTVDYATADGTAIAGQDYTATNGTLNFAAGEVSKIITITTLDDTIVEADETFSLTLSNPSGGTIAPPATQILTIRNDDTQYEFHPVSLNQSVSETATEAQFRIVRTGRFSEETITFSTTDGTATAPQDYSTVSMTVNFAESQTEAIISVPLNNDNFDEINEFFTVTLSNPPFGATLGTNFTTNLNITDDDASHTVENATYYVPESAGIIAVKVRRNVSTVATSVAYRTVNITAIQPEDYTETTGTLNFAVGVSEITVNVPIILNFASEPDETFRFELFNPSPGNLGTPNSTVITILDEALTVPVAPGLVSWWTGDGNSLDVRSRFDGTMQGAFFSDGYIGQAFNFSVFDDSFGDHISTELDVQPSAMPETTWEVWVRPRLVNHNQRQAIMTNDDGGFDRAIQIERFTSNFSVFTGTGAWQPAPVSLNQWQHIAVVYTPTSIKFYKNGVEYDYGSAPVGQETVNKLQFGRNLCDCPTFEYYEGMMDEPAVYKRALSAAEIQKIYNVGNGGKHKPTATVAPTGLIGFWSGDGNASDIAGTNNGTLQNGAGFAIGKVGQSFKLDGVDDAILLGNSPSLNVNSVTLEAWINTNDIPAGGLKNVVSKWGFDGQVDSYLLSIVKIGGAIRVFGAIGTGVGGDSGLFGGEILPNSWTHIAMTYNAADGDNRLFINGAQVASRTRTGGIFASNLNVYIGREDSNQVRQFNGSIDEVSIYNRALLQNEISSNYNAGLAGKLKTVTTPTGISPQAVSITVGDATINFPSVTAAGTTQQIPLDANLFPVLTLGTHAGLIYDIATSASFTGNPTVCFNLPAFTAAQFTNLRVLHFENGNWVNVTASSNAYPTLCTNPVSSFSPFAIANFVPLAANISISGRIINSNGNGIAKVRVSLTNQQGETRILQTNPFGFYKFEEVAAGETYVISINHKRYVFNPSSQVLNVSENVEDVNFVSLE